jgi:acetylornithine deacetylase
MNMNQTIPAVLAANQSPDERAIAILRELVRFDTVSRNSNLALIGWIETYLAGHGITGQRIVDPTGTKASLLATIGPASTPGYVLSGHTDVVPVDNQDWSSDPFELRIADGKAYGRGTSDMKGFVACALAIVPELVASPLAKPVHLAFSYDEEIGCVGVRPMLEIIAANPVKPLGAIIGEPSQMQVVIGHKGKRSVRARIIGTNAHSSLAPTAVNAVQFGAEIVGKVAAVAARLAAEGPRDDLYDVIHSTGHVGLFNGGEALNIVPALAEMLFEFRTIGADDADALVAEVIAFGHSEVEPRMKAIDARAGIEFDIYAGFPGLDTASEEPLVTLAKSLAGRNDHAKVAYGTEAGLFTTMVGIPAVVIGPGSITQAHKADEFIALSEISGCMAMLERLTQHCRV